MNLNGYSQTPLKLVQVATGITRPVDIQNMGDNRLFIVSQTGVIYILDSAYNKLATPFLDINSKVIDSGNERGLLGLAFHPQYKQNGYFFVHYDNNDGNSVIARYSVSPDSNIADVNSEVILKVITQPFSNHKGGCLQFGNDGYLYIGMGDGGSQNDPNGNAQNPKSYLGKMLRIDVDNGSPYGIPSDNPFINTVDTFPEIWAFGYRNPWRFSFDKLTHDLWIADVGQGAWEEVDFEPSGVGGLNYGWRCLEGFMQTANQAGCDPNSVFTPPVAVYAHTQGNCSITGGYVYRGNKYPGLYGKYIYTDYCTGFFWLTYPGKSGNWITKKIADLSNNDYSSFGLDKNDELYLAANTSGKVFRIDLDCQEIPLTYSTINACKDSLNGQIQVSSPNQLEYIWSNGDTTNTINNLSPGFYKLTVIDSVFCATVIDSIQIKEVISSDTIIQLNATLYLQTDTLATNFQWYQDSIPIAGANESTYEPTETGIYYVTYNLEGCTFTSDSFKVEITINKNLTSPDIKVWPNPAKNILNIRSSNSNVELNSINVYNALGQIIITKQINDLITTLDISNYPTGIYAIEAKQGDKRKLIKFMKN